MWTKMAAVAAAGFLMVGAARAEERVAVGGETLFVLKADADLGKSAKQRASDAYDRMRDTLGDPRVRARDIVVKPLWPGAVKIVARRRLIVPIGEAEAQAHGMSVEALASEWQAALRRKWPVLKARPDLTVKSIRAHPIKPRRKR